MNDGYSESRDEGQLAWLKQWSLVIVETELSMMGNTTRGSKDLFPDYIYYGANQQDVEEHVKKASETRSLEVSKIQGPQPYVATHKTMQNNLREEISTLMSSQDQIQNEVTEMSELVRRLIDRLDQHVPASQYDQEFSLMESNFYSPSPTVSSLTAASVTSSSLGSRHTTRDRSCSELVPNTLSRPRMPMAESQKRHLGSQHRRRTSGSTHRTVVNPGSSLPTSTQKTQTPQTLASPESADTSTTTALTYEADVEVKETSKITGPAASNGSPWSHGVISKAEAVVSDDTGAVGDIAGIAESPASGASSTVAHGAKSSDSGSSHATVAVAISGGVVTVDASPAAADAPRKDGIWKRTVKVLSTRKAHVDEVCPIKTSYVYYDDDVYDALLTEKSTGVTCVIQLICDAETKVYYIYYRSGETDYKLDGPYRTIGIAKDVFQLIFKDKFDIEWTERETAVSDKWTYETKTYETFEEVEEVEEVVDETKAQEIISQQEREVEENPTTVTESTTTTTTEEAVVTEEDEVSKPADSKGSLFGHLVSSTEAAAGAVGTAASEVAGAAGSAAKSPARRVGSAASETAGAVVHGAESAARGVGHAAEAVAIGTGAVVIGGGLLATGALHKVDGVWKRTVQVLTARKALVDEVCPIAKTSYVYYDNDVYDAVLTEKGTGVTYVTQLIYDTETKVYYVYYRYGETDYKLDGPYMTIEAAKEAFQLTYKDKFNVEWTERKTAVSDKWTYETKTYETFEEVEE
ncbi:hypothetical protein BGX20_005384, partial [Mortierella sp. AD010]